MDGREAPADPRTQLSFAVMVAQIVGVAEPLDLGDSEIVMPPRSGHDIALL